MIYSREKKRCLDILLRHIKRGGKDLHLDR